MSLDIDTIKQSVQKLLANEQSGHADDHTFRVYELAHTLCQQEKADAEIVSLAALLHDCDDYKVFGQACADDMPNAKNIMAQVGVDPAKQEIVLEIIRTMGYSKLLKGIRPQTIEGKIVSDADMLDAMGAMGVIRCLAFALTKNGKPYFDKDIWPELNLSSEAYKNPLRKSDNFINHFFEKLLKLKGHMLTDSGKTEAQNRHAFMIGFLKQFFHENKQPDWTAYLESYLKKNDASLFINSICANRSKTP